MIYTVELNFSDHARESEWKAWYETYLTQLVTVPGINTAQRFRALEPNNVTWEYLALYSIESLAAYESEAYRNIGGGGNASIRFKEAISRRRNVYEGIEHVPEVTENCKQCRVSRQPWPECDGRHCRVCADHQTL
jgi:hypothetical protein